MARIVEEAVEELKLTSVFKQGKWGFADLSGNVVVPCEWEDVGIFFEGFAKVMNKHGKWGFINRTGKVICPCQWMYVVGFCDGYGHVEDEKHKWWNIDETGQVVGVYNPFRNYEDI